MPRFRGSGERATLTGMEPLRILLVDDRPQFLTATERWLDRPPDMRVVGRAASAEEGLQRVDELRPDLVLMDLSLPGMSGLEAARAIKQRRDPPRVVIVTAHDSSEYRVVAGAVPADGFLSKSEFSREIMGLIRKLFSGSPGPPGTGMDPGAQ